MARNLQLALSLLARDGASKVLKQAMQDIIKQTRSTQKAGDEQAKSQQQNTSSAIRASRTLQDEYRRASSARSSLGIRSEREIQREIQQTQAAYNRLTRAGTMSANEQNRAFRAMTERVSKLRTELVGTSETMTRMQRMRVVGTTATAVVGGVVAAGAMLAQPVTNQMDYRSRLAMMANTAYAERGLAGRREGMNEMDTLIRSSVRTGGGSKESAAETLDSMLASGAVSMTSAKTMLPLIQKYSTATGAAPTDLANIAIKLKQSFGIKDEDLEKALNMAISAGQSGSFELRDMAKWLPSQLASASNAGMKGLDDFSALLGWNQASAITAGSSDQAGNNLNNLLLKLNSQDASNAAARIKMPNGKGIDLSGSLAKGVGKGINPLDAFNQIVDRVVASNPAYKKLEDKLKNATGTERTNIINSQAKILEGSGIGKIIADQQALLALLGYRGNKGYTKDVIADANAQRKLAPGQTAGDINFSLMSEQSDFKVNQLKNEKDFAEMNSVSPLADALGDASEKLTKYAQEYPELTTALSGATTAIKAMSAAAVAFAGINFLTGGGIKMPGGGAAQTGGALGRAWGAVKGSSSRIGGSLLGKILAPLALYQGAEDAPLINVERGDANARQRLKDNKYSSSTARMLDSVKARPGLMDAVDEISSWWSSPSTIGKSDPATTGVPSYLLPQQQKSQPVTIITKVMLDQREIAQGVNEFNGEQANRGSTGGPQ